MNTKQQTLQARKQQLGITLIEVSIGLIIAAIVAAVAFVAFQNNSRRNEVRENTVAITEIIAEAKQKFGRTNQFSALTGTNVATTDPALASQTIPTRISTGGNTYGVRPILYGSTLAGALDNTATPGASFATLAWGGVPADQCFDLLSSLAQTTNALRVVNAATNPLTTATPTGATLLNADGSLNAATASTACAGITASGILYFTFDRG